MKKVLLTGANGFIGNNVLEHLLQRDYEIHAVSSKNIMNNCNRANWHKVNLLDIKEIESMMTEIQPDLLIHLAWYAVPSKYINAEENLLWVQSSTELLKNFKRVSGKKFVFAGTCLEYDSSYEEYEEEITPSNPSTLYGICKYSFENMAREYCYINNLEFVSGRVFNLYGPREYKQRMIPYVINNLLSGEIANCTHGNQIRDYMHVFDVASAFVEIMECNINGVVNIGSGIPIKIKDLITMIGKKLNNNELIKFGSIEVRQDESPTIVANNNKLKMRTNWTKKYDIEIGLDETIEWWKKERTITNV